MTTQKKVVIGVGIGAGVLTLCCVGSLLAAAQLPDSDPREAAAETTVASSPAEPTASTDAPSQAPPTQPPTPTTTQPADGPFDRAVFDEYWTGGSVPPSVQASVVSVHWSGVALVAETSIVPDGDAETAARSVCSALSAFWLTTGDGVFRPVQVVGTDGGVLVSRATVGQQCEWRR